jgi:hypothetical protein
MANRTEFGYLMNVSAVVVVFASPGKWAGCVSS